MHTGAKIGTLTSSERSACGDIACIPEASGTCARLPMGPLPSARGPRPSQPQEPTNAPCFRLDFERRFFALDASRGNGWASSFWQKLRTKGGLEGVVKFPTAGPDAARQERKGCVGRGSKTACVVVKSRIFLIFGIYCSERRIPSYRGVVKHGARPHRLHFMYYGSS